MIYRLSFLLFFLLTAWAPAHSKESQKPLKIVASFSILGNIVKTVGGKEIEVFYIVQENEDPHIFRPTPETSLLLAKADGVFINGLGLEGWFSRLITASGYKGNVFIAAKGIEGERAPCDHPSATPILDPHAWHSLVHVQTYAQNIADDLSRIRPEKASYFEKNAQAFIDEVQKIYDWAQKEVSKIPKSQRKVVTGHDAFFYLGRDLGIEFVSPQGVTTEAEPSAKDVARVIQFVKKNNIKTVFVESLTSQRLIRELADEAGATVGAELYTDALSKKGGPAPTYPIMARHNLTHIFSAMSESAQLEASLQRRRFFS